MNEIKENNHPRDILEYLLDQKEEIFRHLNHLERTMADLNNLIETNNNQIYKVCNHMWEKDYSARDPCGRSYQWICNKCYLYRRY